MTGNDHFGSNSSSLVYPIGSMYGIYANIWGILMVNVTIYSIHGSYGYVYWQVHRSLMSLPMCWCVFQYDFPFPEKMNSNKKHIVM